MSIRIGLLEFSKPTFMAPMEGITDVPFRRIVRKHGCGVICTQMVHAEGLLRGTQRRMKEVTALDPREKPVGIQLCGHEPEIFSQAARRSEEMGFAFIDINMGCPAKNIVKIGSGAALMKSPSQAASMVRAVVSSTSVPVTVKIRAGWDDDDLSAVAVSRAVENEGASLIAVHARTKSQKHRGKADWDLIRELKENVSVPVIGNGDVYRPGDADRMIGQTGADGVMVARGALGNPWIFENRRPAISEIQTTLLEHLDFHLSFYANQAAALMTFRKHLVWYTKGLAHAAEFRMRLFKENSYNTILEMIKTFFSQLDPIASPDLPHAG